MRKQLLILAAFVKKLCNAKNCTFTHYPLHCRYIMSEQKKAEEFGITEDDVSEIRQVELETKGKRRFAKISHSRRRPLLVDVKLAEKG